MKKLLLLLFLTLALFCYNAISNNGNKIKMTPQDLFVDEPISLAYGPTYPYPGYVPPDDSSLDGTLGGSSYGDTSTLQPAYDPNQAALYDLGIGNINSAIGALPGQLEGGYSSIESSYQNALNQLLGGKNRAEGEYGTTKTQTAQDWRSGKNTISD